MRALRAFDPPEIGPYRMLAELGRGGMGRVLLGSGPDGRLVALKVVHEHFAEDDGFRARFKIEVAATRAVSGAYTAAVVDAAPDAPVPWLASVFVPGPSLLDTIETTGALPEQSVLRLAAGLATALIQIHRAGLVHRDLKPSNVLLADDGPRVIDFGIARAINGNPASNLTRAGWLVGSPAFMSPEQAKGDPVTPASDVFSLGSVVVAACTGASPFTNTATLQTLNDVVHADPDLSGVSTAIRRIVEPCLAKDPAERPTPAVLLETIGQITPAARPWPAAVHDSIAQRHSEIARFLDPSDEHDPAPLPPTQLLDPWDEQTADLRADAQPLPPTRVNPGPLVDPGGEPDGAESPTRRTRRLVGVGAIVGTVALVSALAWTLSPHRPPPRSSPTSPPRADQVGVLANPTAVGQVAFSSDGRTLAAAGSDGAVRVWDVASRTQVGAPIGPTSSPDGHVDHVDRLAFSSDGRELVTTASDKWVFTWDLTGRKLLADPFTVDPSGTGIQVSGISSDGRTVATSYDPDGEVYLWDVASQHQVGERVTSGNTTSNVTSAVVFSADNRALVTEFYDAVEMWDVASHQQIGDVTFPSDVRDLHGAALSPDNRTLAVAELNDKVLLWDVSSNNQVGTIPASVASLIFSPDGRILATRTDDGTVQLWDVASHRQIVKPVTGVSSMAFSPDGRTLATGSIDHTVRLWALPSNR